VFDLFTIDTASITITPAKACESLKEGGLDPDNYSGCQHLTRSGRTCQKWTSQSPHGHSSTPANKADKGVGDNNYCRNPDNDGGGIWCYTSDPATRWEYCTPEEGGGKIRLAVKMKIYFEINIDLVIDLSLLQDIFNGKFLSVASTALKNLLDKLKNFSPCDCKSEWKAPMRTTNGPYMKSHTGQNALFCGATTGSKRECGRYIVPCGVSISWCSGRRRWYAAPWYPCSSSTKHCCFNVPTVTAKTCTWELPAIGSHISARRRYCHTKSFCGSNTFQKCKYNPAFRLGLTCGSEP